MRIDGDAADSSGARLMSDDVRKYFYWSERRIRKIVTDDGLTVDRSGSTKLKSPAAPFLPSVEVDRSRQPLNRPQVAELIERHLSGLTVRDFVTPPKVRFAAGCGTLTFSEFINFGRVENLVSVFTSTEASDGTRVAIGMFGSKDNLADVIAAAPTSTNGWSSSAAPQIFAFIESFGRRVPKLTHRREIAREAVNLLAHQGGNLGEGEKRGFTFGHLGDHGEWLMEAYLDEEFEDDSLMTDGRTFDRVILGAPL
jgi:hypothetical protein